MSDVDMRERIRESNLIEGIDDPAEVTRSLMAWRYLMEHDQLTHDLVCEVQQQICWTQDDLARDQKGFYRSVSKVNVRVGSHIAPDWSQVDDLMEEWLNLLDDFSPWDNHVKFETIHPFRDGNGRVGRCLYWWDEIRRGHTPTLIKARDRQNYYHALSAGRPLDRDVYVRRLMALFTAEVAADAWGSNRLSRRWDRG